MNNCNTEIIPTTTTTPPDCDGPEVTNFANTPTETDTTTLYLSDEEVSFDDAKAQCDGAGDGFFLATLTDQEEADSVFGVTGMMQVWVGLRSDIMVNCENEECNGQVTWEGGKGDYMHSDLGYNIQFKRNRPSCIRTKPGILIDVPCSATRKFLCQRDKPDGCPLK
ncbi:uncharacterized protein LOC131882719 [Tigriopus californicus]|uniref:uncharacterized protein LOC131882719 n=1 Tax=Tigriopus californicus TaxID=6832 RepID=UPI0027DA1AFD|nr:uncharacterized protein LOC131882719 [Tigriopus californicus]